MRFKLAAFVALFFATNIFTSTTNALEPVRLRADAHVVDGNGTVIGVPNTSDSRNNRFETFYYSIDSNGNSSASSVFKVTGNPHNSSGGYVRIDLAPANGELDGQVGQQAGNGSNSGDVKVYGEEVQEQQLDPTVSYNNDNIEKSRYDLGGQRGSVYGDF